MAGTNWDLEVDVIVAGSGAAGLSAALAAKSAGAEVLVLEKTDKIGGTSAVSGGVCWIPNNDHMGEVGTSDSRDQAMTYLRSLSLGMMDDRLLEVYVDNANKVVRFLETEASVQFRAMRLPDYHPEFPGATHGRSLAPTLFPAKELDENRPFLRGSGHFPVPFTMFDLDDGINIFDPEVMLPRMQADMVGTGHALIAALLKAVSERGVKVMRNARMKRLVKDEDVVSGVEVDMPDGVTRIRARRGVILACGGFEWNSQLVSQFLIGPVERPLSPPGNEGDGLLMAMEAGAALGNMSEAWWCPALAIPNEEYDGRSFGRLSSYERRAPGTIVVNSKGRRFVNEAHNYNDIGRVMAFVDPVDFQYSNIPAWLIMHQGFMDRYTFITKLPGEPVPSWLVEAPTLRELAGKIDVDPDGLEQTVQQFNADVAGGHDDAFRRGDSYYDVFRVDDSRTGALRTLGALDEGPFYACRIYSGVIGTKGGPVTNENAQVLTPRGVPIPGLFAAGNVMASIFGRAYPGAGGTLGPALTFGHIAGRFAAGGNT